MNLFRLFNIRKTYLMGIIMTMILTNVISLIVPQMVQGKSLSQPPSPANAPYIIVFKDSVNPRIAVPEMAKAYGLQPGFIYEHALNGMSALVPSGRLIALQHDPRVAYVVEDMERSIFIQETPTGIQRIYADTNSEIDIDGSDDYRVDVDVAVIDTGIDFEHPDLDVVGGVNCTVFKWFSLSTVCEPGGDDDHYHGTHVAGTIGAIDNNEGVVGVAPGARLWAVKVLNSRGSGYTSWIVAGIDWVAAHADTIEIANMSLGGSGFNQAEYDAIQGAVNAGVAFAVAAGNEDDDANNYSPGGFDNVLSVSALADFDGIPGGSGSPTCRTDQDDTLADFSNWGPEVDIAAPGVCILSTFPLEEGAYGTISGTSMASPHVAGALALLASANNPGNAADVYSLYNQVKNTGNYDWTDDSGDGLKEPLLDVRTFNPVLISTGVPTNQPPTAAFTYKASTLTVTFTDQSTDPDGTITAWNWAFGDGTTATAQNPSHTYVTADTYTVSLTVTDDQGATNSITHEVTVTSQSTSTITVASLTDTSYLLNKNFWKASVVVTLDPALSGAAVYGTWGDNSSFTCTTDSKGACSASTNVRTKISSITLTITDVVLAEYQYEPPPTTSIVVYLPK